MDEAMWIHRVEYDIQPLKKEDILQHVTIWMNLEDIVLRYAKHGKANIAGFHLHKGHGTGRLLLAEWKGDCQGLGMGWGHGDSLPGTHRFSYGR